MAITLIATLLVALVWPCSDESGHFLLQYSHEGYANRLPQPLFHHLFIDVLI
jgi:hypothetical protein